MTSAGRRSLLVLGGTAWLGREVALHAAAQGWSVTCLARGEAGAAPDGVQFIRADRTDQGAYADAAARTWDAVVDVTWQPGMAREAVVALGERAARWVYVSSISAYAGEGSQGQQEDAPLLAPWMQDEATVEEYGPAKSACEAFVRNAVGERGVIARPGLIIGPGDPSDRFGYWVGRMALAEREPVLVPDAAEQRTQSIDVRDVAALLVKVAGEAAGGAYNVVGPTTTLGEVLAQCAAAADFGGVWATASEAFLAAEAVEPWAGPRSLPLWLPAAEAGLLGSTPDERAVAAGLHPRPLDETIADVLVDERHRGLDRPRRAGLTRGDELELISKLS